MFKTAAKMVSEILNTGIPDVRQQRTYTCGVSALRAILAHFGIRQNENDLVKELDITSKKGTSPDTIVRGAQKYGLQAGIKENMSYENLKTFVAKNIPIIVAIQDWPDSPQKNLKNDWTDGHYVIVLDANEKTITVEDPAVIGRRRTFDKKDFEERWHDTDGKKRYIHTGIYFVKNIKKKTAAKMASEILNRCSPENL